MPLPGGYPAPEVLRVSPLTLPIQGGVLTLNGTSLGPGPCEDRGQRSAVVLHITPTPDVSGSTSLTFHPTTRTWSSSPPLTPREVECAVCPRVVAQ